MTITSGLILCLAIAVIISCFIIVVLFKALNTIKKKRDELELTAIKLNGEIDYLKALGDLKDEVYKKSNERKSALDSGDSRNRFNSARDTLVQNNKN